MRAQSRLAAIWRNIKVVERARESRGWWEMVRGVRRLNDTSRRGGLKEVRAFHWLRLRNRSIMTFSFCFQIAQRTPERMHLHSWTSSVPLRRVHGTFTVAH